MTSESARSFRAAGADVTGLSVRRLAVSDAHEYYALIDANRSYLSRYGDYQDERDATAD